MIDDYRARENKQENKSFGERGGKVERTRKREREREKEKETGCNATVIDEQ